MGIYPREQHMMDLQWKAAGMQKYCLHKCMAQLVANPICYFKAIQDVPIF